MAWEDNYNPLFVDKLKLEDKKEWRFTLEEHKTKGTMQVNVRLFKLPAVEGGYEGPTKNGFILQINSVEELDNLQKAFNDYFEKVKKML